MTRHDLSFWPLVITVADDTMDADDQKAFFKEWNRWLDREEQFATLRVFTTINALARPRGGGKEAKSWLEANKGRIKGYVVGMATVVPPKAFDDVSRMDAERLFGVPARVFRDNETALNWIYECLGDARARIDEAAVRQHLEADR